MYLRAQERSKTKITPERDYYVTMGMAFKQGSFIVACLFGYSFPPTYLEKLGGFAST
jgi:hypothetical protein